jgi:hypothetical protein
MIKSKGLGFATLMWMILACAPVSFGQTVSPELPSSGILNLKLKEANVHLALSKLTGCYGAPIGFEFALTDKEPFNGNIEVEMQSGTLGEALDAIVKQDARYEWRVVDGVINVFPKSDRDGVLASILEARVKQFFIKKGASLYQIRTDIVALPEIKSKLEQAKVMPSIEGFFGGDFRPAGRDFSLNASNMQLREIMNQIIRESGVKYWVVNRYGDNNKSLILNF